MSSPDRTFADGQRRSITPPATGNDDVAPWELAGADRPRTLPEPQRAPWEQFIQFEPPWELGPPADDGLDSDPPRPQAAPSHLTAAQPALAETRPARRQQPRSYPDDSLFAGQPFDEDADPYDADAPLADDLEPLRHSHSPVNVAAVSSAARPSVFGDMFSRPAPAQPPVTPQAQAPEPPQPETHAEPDAAPDGPDAAPDGPGPFDWPPIPTDLPTAHAAQDEQPATDDGDVPDPLSWPPIPHDLPGAFGQPTYAHPAAGPVPAEIDERELPWQSEPTGRPEADDFEAMPWSSRSFEPQPEPEPEPELAPWSYAEPEVADAPWLEPGVNQQEPGGAVQLGSEFAPLAAESDVDPVIHPRVSTMTFAEAPAVERPEREHDGDGDGDGDGGLWFLSGQPREPATGGAALDEDEPSSFQTTILTVLVALGVIALVILVLAMFTSVFD